MGAVDDLKYYKQVLDGESVSDTQESYCWSLHTTKPG